MIINVAGLCSSPRCRAARPGWITGDKGSEAIRRRQFEARLARELTSDAEVSIQEDDVLSALTGVGDQRRCAKDLATHLLWSPSRFPHHADQIQRRELTNTPRRLP